MNDKQFKQRGSVMNRIVKPRPELEGMTRKVDYKEILIKLRQENNSE